MAPGEVQQRFAANNEEIARLQQQLAIASVAENEGASLVGKLVVRILETQVCTRVSRLQQQQLASIAENKGASLVDK